MADDELPDSDEIVVVAPPSVDMTRREARAKIDLLVVQKGKIQAQLRGVNDQLAALRTALGVPE